MARQVAIPRIPSGWSWVRLSDICESVEKVNPRLNPDKEFSYIEISSIDNSKQKITETKKLKGQDAPSRARQLVHTDDILFSTVRVYLKKIAMVEENPELNVASTGFCVIRPRKGIEKKLIFYLVQSNLFLVPLNEIQRGTHYPTVRSSDVLNQSVPLPPLAEQKRIVSKIEYLFAQRNATIEKLEKIPPLLKNFRISLLSKAFKGDLINPDRKLPNLGLFGESEPIEDISSLIGNERNFKLPQKWAWASLGELLDNLQYGTSEKAAATKDSGIPILRMGNIQVTGLDLSDLKYIELSDKDRSKYLLKKGDVLINRTNSAELVGKSTTFELEGDFLFASYLIRLQVKPSVILPLYLSYFINSVYGRSYIDSVKHQVAGQANINSKNIKSMPIPVAPLVEQRLIVEKIVESLLLAEQIEYAVRKAIERTETTTQSILAKAFSGELVPQDSNDEPADILIKRIASQSIAEQVIKVNEKPSAHTIKKAVVSKKQSLYSFLKENGETVVQEAFEASGESTSNFWNELEAEIQSGRVEQHRKGYNIYLRVKD